MQQVYAESDTYQSYKSSQSPRPEKFIRLVKTRTRPRPSVSVQFQSAAMTVLFWMMAFASFMAVLTVCFVWGMVLIEDPHLNDPPAPRPAAVQEKTPVDHRLSVPGNVLQGEMTGGVR